MKHKFEVIPKEEVLSNRCNAYEFINFDKDMKQTAVEYLIENLIFINSKNWDSIVEQAKEMEKQQIIDAQENGQSIYSDIIRCDKSKQYYKETFNK